MVSPEEKEEDVEEEEEGGQFRTDKLIDGLSPSEAAGDGN